MLNKSTSLARWKEFWNLRAQDPVLLRQVGLDAAALKNTYEAFAGILRPNNGDTLVDFGCGNGLLTLCFADTCEKVHGVDFAQDLIQAATSVVTERQINNAIFSVDDITNSKFPPEQFSLAICAETFQYFPNVEYAENVIRELLRVSKSGSRILISHIRNKGHWGYWIWRIIRNPSSRNYKELKYIDTKYLSNFGRIKRRLKTLFRRPLGLKVESDDWSWFSKTDFVALASRIPEIQSIEFLDTDIGRSYSYQFNMLIVKK